MEANEGTQNVVTHENEPRDIRCPSCGKPMHYYGGSAGYICCDFKILYRLGGWFDEQGRHVLDDRLAGGTRRVDQTIVKANTTADSTP